MQFARTSKLPVPFEEARLQSRRQAVDSTQQAPQGLRFWVAQLFWLAVTGAAFCSLLHCIVPIAQRHNALASTGPFYEAKFGSPLNGGRENIEVCKLSYDVENSRSLIELCTIYVNGVSLKTRLSLWSYDLLSRIERNQLLDILVFPMITIDTNYVVAGCPTSPAFRDVGDDHCRKRTLRVSP